MSDKCNTTALAEGIYKAQCGYVGADHAGECTKIIKQVLDSFEDEIESTRKELAEALSSSKGAHGAWQLWLQRAEAVEKELEASQNELSRLRGALESIKKFRRDWSGIADQLQQIAKKALNFTPDKE